MGALRRAARAVYVAGQGQVPVTRNKGATLEGMGSAAIHAALEDAGMERDRPTALFVGNMMSGMLSKQQHLGPFLCHAARLGHIESTTIEACCGAGGAALRMGYMAVASGLHDTVLVAGVEAMTHAPTDQVTEALATASHWPSEGAAGHTFVSLNALLMEKYMAKYGTPHRAFAPFPMVAHANAMTSDVAVFHKPLDEDTFDAAQTLTAPVQLFDACPTCDGAAVVLLTSSRNAAARSDAGGAVVRVAGSGAATDILPVAERPEPLHLTAVGLSTEQALAEAGLSRADVDVFELHDAYSIMACLSLESAGFAPPGGGVDLAARGGIALDGAVPMATFGGLKARGHPVGATGVYQAAETYLQLLGKAGPNQVGGARVGLVQNIGGAGSSVYTHALVQE